MASVVVWNFLLRAAQAFVEAAPTIFCGLLIAAVLRRMVGPAAVRRLFGTTTWRGVATGWGLGMLLPVCAIGVIPVSRELRRCGVPAAAVVVFTLVAPLLNPISFLYGLTLSDPMVICSFAVGSLVVACLAGSIWERVHGELPEAVALAAAQADAEPLPAPGARRLLAVVASAGTEWIGPTIGYCLLGIAGAGLLGALLPYGSMQASMRHSDSTSALLMAAVALPACNDPLRGMMKLGLMFEHGNSVGAAFTLFMIGLGFNLASLTWLGRSYGCRAAVVWLALVIGFTLLLAYPAERMLYFAHEELDHTHAFDDFSGAFPLGGSVSAAEVVHKLTERVGVLEQFGLAGLLVLTAVGAAIRLSGRSKQIEEYLTVVEPRQAVEAGWDIALPGRVLGACCVIGLVVLSILAAYIYYPPVETNFADMATVRTGAIYSVRTGNRDEAIRQIERWDLLTRKLQVGVLLRTGRLDPDSRQAAEDLRERLEELRDALIDGADAAAVTEHRLKVEAAYSRCREAFLKTEGASGRVATQRSLGRFRVIGP